MKAALLLALFPLAGCASVNLQEIDRGAEVVFQTAHVIDAVQTYRGSASDSCYAEGDPITRRIIGREPSKAGVIAWGVGYGALHYGVTRLLMDHGHDYLAAAWEAVTIETTGRGISQNISVGVRLWGSNTLNDCDARDLSHMPVRR